MTSLPFSQPPPTSHQYDELTLLVGRSASMKSTTGTAFAYGLQSGFRQLGGVNGPQLFRSKYAAGGYRVSYGVCCGAVGISFLAACWICF